MSRILHLSRDANFHLYRKPVKMSYSFDRLAALVRTELNKDIIHGDTFTFLNKQRTTIKIMVYKDKGFSIFYRRLDAGSFQLPLIASDHISYKMSVNLRTSTVFTELLIGLKNCKMVLRRAKMQL